MGVSSDGGRRMRASIAEQMAKHVRPRRRDEEPSDDVPRVPRPTEKPHPDAQWDEAAGRWEVWSRRHQGWVSLDDGSLQQPATPSVGPSVDPLPHPRTARP